MKTNNHNQQLGHWGEICAEKYLLEAGYSLVARNVRTPEGEIDLIVKNENMVVFVEVKTRSSQAVGYPEEAVTEEKLEHMVNSAEWYMLEHPDIGENWRIDVVAILTSHGLLNPQIEWFQDAA